MTTPCSVPGRSALVSPSPGGWPEPGVRVPRRVRSWGGLASGQRAVGRELPQQRGEFSLNIDHPPGGPQLAPQPLVLLTQPRILPIPRIRRRPTHRRREALARSPVPLLLPCRDQRGVQTLPPQQGTFTCLAQPPVLDQDPGLLPPRVGPRPSLGRHLGIRHLLHCGTHPGMISSLALKAKVSAPKTPHHQLAKRCSP